MNEGKVSGVAPRVELSGFFFWVQVVDGPQAMDEVGGRTGPVLSCVQAGLALSSEPLDIDSQDLAIRPVWNEIDLCDCVYVVLCQGQRQDSPKNRVS